ncbi:MAG: polysaccharide deacetylase family protein, partial [Armatimonadota bacterium]
AAPAEPSYLERIGEGIDLLRGDTPRQAEDTFAAANLQDYSDSLGWVGLGAARLGRGYVDRAMADFAQAAHLAARGSQQARAVAPLAQFGRAICLLQRGEVHAAAEELEALAQSEFEPALPALAYAKLSAGDPEGAQETAKSALESLPDDPLALAVLGRTLPGSESIPPLERAAEVCPGSRYAAPLTALALPNIPRSPSQPQETEVVRLDIIEGPPRRAVVTWLGSGEPSYVILRVDGRHAGMSNTTPHQFGLPRELAPGPHGVGAEVWADRTILGRTGTVVWSAAEGEPPDRYDGTEYAAALEGLRSALAPIPNRVHLHYWLARAHAPANQKAALRHYERVVALDPGFADARQRATALCAALGLKGSTSEVSSVPDKRVCLTFDDGPHPIYTERILQALRDANVRATFVVVGTQARAHPELLRAIAADGHEIANHSYSHDDMTRKTTAEIQQELLRTQAIVEDATGQHTRLFRPPGGQRNAAVRAAAAAVGYRTILWSANVSVCAGLPAEKGVARLLQDVKPGAIVLLHNGPDESADILPGLLAALKKRGYTFAALSDAMGR